MFVTFEGTEGAGKSAVMSLLRAERSSDRWLRAGLPEPVFTREPGAGVIGPAIRKILLESESLNAPEELFLFLADRSSHVATVVRPAIATGKLVLCDRYADSTIVYQGYGRGIDLSFLKLANAMATQGTVPDRTFLFDVDPEIGLARIHSKDRLDREPLEFHRLIREGFLQEANLEPNRWRILDASLSLDALFEQVWIELTELCRSRTG